MKGRFKYFAIGAVLLLAAWWLVEATLGDDSGHWITVDRDDLVLEVEITGTLRAIESSTLGPPQLRDYWDYKIAHMTPEGEDVVEGTPVLAFDASDLEQKLRQKLAEAEEARKTIEKTEKSLSLQAEQDTLRLAEAEARLRKGQLKLDQPGDLARSRELALARLDRDLADDEVRYLLTRSEASRRSADAQLAALSDQQVRAEQRVEEIQAAIEDMVRKAPRDGTVVYVTNWRDEKKKVGDTCWQNESVMELPDLSRMEAEGKVDEADAGKLEEGQQVSLRLDAHPDVEFSGTIDSIWRTVQKESWRNPLKVVRFRVVLGETDTRKMRPGMRFRGKVETGRVAEAVLIPIEAVFPTDEGPLVYRRSMFGHQPVLVELGRRNADEVEVLGGLEAGAEISLVDPDVESG